MTTKHIIVREIITSTYSGSHSVKGHEYLAVEIKWIDGEPKKYDGYTMCGEWTLAEIPYALGPAPIAEKSGLDESSFGPERADTRARK